MNLNEFIVKSGYAFVDFCHKHNLNYYTTQRIRLGYHTPNLLTVLKLLHISKGEVKIEALLTKDDAIKFRDFKKEAK